MMAWILTILYLDGRLEAAAARLDDRIAAVALNPFGDTMRQCARLVRLNGRFQSNGVPPGQKGGRPLRVRAGKTGVRTGTAGPRLRRPQRGQNRLRSVFRAGGCGGVTVRAGGACGF